MLENPSNRTENAEAALNKIESDAVESIRIQFKRFRDSEDVGLAEEFLQNVRASTTRDGLDNKLIEALERKDPDYFKKVEKEHFGDHDVLGEPGK